MSKNKTRLIVVITAIVTIISTFCYAETEANQTNNTNVEPRSQSVTTSTENEVTVTDTESEEYTSENEENYSSNLEQEVYEGDLFLFDSDVTMDKLVDGNVFIFGNNVTITGQASGNMFIFGNNITFDKAYVQASVFICGNNVKFNAVSSSLYCASQKLSIDSQFGVYLDLYSACSTFDFSGIVGRNSFIGANSINLGNNATFYGDLNYSSSSEIEIPENVVEGKVNYSKFEEKSEPTIASYISSLIQLLILVIVTFFIVKLFTKAPGCKECAVLSHPFKTFGIGLLSIVTIFVAIMVLLFSMVGAETALVGLGIYLLLFAIAKLIFAISLSRYLCIGKSNKGIKEFLLTILISVILWALSLVPFIGTIFNMIVTVFGFGIIIYTPLKKKAHCSNKKIESTKDESPVKDSEKSDKKVSEEQESETDTKSDDK